jgi:uncharacterized phosphosugar-binding protein
MISPPASFFPRASSLTRDERMQPVTSLSATYLAAATDLLQRAGKANRPALQKLGPILGRSVAEGGMIHTFGSGHSEIIAREIVGRAGGLVCVNVIDDPTGGFIETLAGYGTRLADRYDRRYGLRAGEIVIVISNSGRHAAPLEVAFYAQQKGLIVVGLTSVAVSRLGPVVGPGGRNLHALADHVLDNCGVPGDTIVEVAGGGIRAAPTSTLVGALLLNLLFLEVIEWLTVNGHPPPLLRSQSLPGAVEHNRELAKSYAGRLSRPLA